MLNITNRSENYNGTFVFNNLQAATIDGSVNRDSIYVNFNCFEPGLAIQNKEDLIDEIGEFFTTLLNTSIETNPAPQYNIMDEQEAPADEIAPSEEEPNDIME